MLYSVLEKKQKITFSKRNVVLKLKNARSLCYALIDSVWKIHYVVHTIKTQDTFNVVQHTSKSRPLAYFLYSNGAVKTDHRNCRLSSFIISYNHQSQYIHHTCHIFLIQFFIQIISFANQTAKIHAQH